MIDMRREWREQQREPLRKHFEDMAKQAMALRAALERDAPKAQEISWKSLSAALELLEASAAEEATSLRPPRKRPVENEWRDSLIAVVNGVYPAGAKRGAHIIDTVLILLGNLADANLLPPGADDHRDLRRTIQLAARKPLPPALRFWLDEAK
ncbi:hypothetical protein [Archangium sp.]|uniref:hypothetical protein n=1 Tax=Archangium sp. TaxID=1872627 RepID=UPI002D3C8790|nr:hypothetical protein [Archangium sp.]HYO52160.1 hypothetical protein [Archangium sp.]